MFAMAPEKTVHPMVHEVTRMTKLVTTSKRYRCTRVIKFEQYHVHIDKNMIIPLIRHAQTQVVSRLSIICSGEPDPDIPLYLM